MVVLCVYAPARRVGACRNVELHRMRFSAFQRCLYWCYGPYHKSLPLGLRHGLLRFDSGRAGVCAVRQRPGPRVIYRPGFLGRHLPLAVHGRLLPRRGFLCSVSDRDLRAGSRQAARASASFHTLQRHRSIETNEFAISFASDASPWLQMIHLIHVDSELGYCPS